MKRIIDFVISLLLCLWVSLQLISCEISPEKNVTSNIELVSKIQNKWISLKEKNLIHGSIRIEQNGKVLFVDGPQNQVYTIASVSKSFVGAAFSDLEKQGLNLDSPICQWLTNFCAGNLGKISINHLLNHYSGLGRDLSLMHFAQRFLNPNWDIQNIDFIKIDDSYLKSPPGSEFRYSNFGYLVLSRLWELIVRKPFSTLIAEQARNAGLKETSLIEKGDIFSIEISFPFSHLSYPVQFHTHLYRSAGTGGVKSSVSDLIKWLNFAAYSSSQRYARGWVQSENHQAIWHNGAAFGSYSLVAILPKQNLKIAIATDNFKFTKQWSNMAEQFEHYFY